MSARTRAAIGVSALVLSPLLGAVPSARAWALLPLPCLSSPALGVLAVSVRADDPTPVVGGQHEVTAQVTAGSLEGTCLVFTQVSGPGTTTGPTVGVTDASGSVSITVGSSDAGRQVLAVVALGGGGQTLAEATVTLTWVVPHTNAPTPEPAPAEPPAAALPSGAPAAQPSAQPAAEPAELPAPAVAPVAPVVVVAPVAVTPEAPVAAPVAAPRPAVPVAAQPRSYEADGDASLAALQLPARAASADTELPTIAPLEPVRVDQPEALEGVIAVSQATAAGAVTAGAVLLFVLLLGSVLLRHSPSGRPRLA